MGVNLNDLAAKPVKKAIDLFDNSAATVHVANENGQIVLLVVCRFTTLEPPIPGWFGVYLL